MLFFLQVLRKIAVVVYNALDYNLHEDEQCQMSQELEELITHMTEDGMYENDEYEKCKYEHIQALAQEYDRQ